MAKTLQITDAIDENLKLVRDADGTDTPFELSKDKIRITADLDVTGNIQGQNINKYYYQFMSVGFNSSSTSASYIPMTGYIIESTSLSGGNERLAMVAPYNGTLERATFRSEIAQNGTIEFDIYESSDGTEVPGSEIGTMDTSVNILDDTSVIQANYMTKLIEILKKDDKKTAFKNIRQLINDSKVKDFSALHKYLFDEVDSYATGHIASVILILAESQYQDSFAVDKELHIMSTIVKLLNELK